MVRVEAICASAWPILAWLFRTASVIKREVERDLGARVDVLVEASGSASETGCCCLDKTSST